MRKKIALAAALLHAPRVLFLDEPFEAIDPVSARTIRGLLERLHRRRGHGGLLQPRDGAGRAALRPGRRSCTWAGSSPRGRPTQVRAGRSLEDAFVELVGASHAGAEELGLAWAPGQPEAGAAPQRAERSNGVRQSPWPWAAGRAAPGLRGLPAAGPGAAGRAPRPAAAGRGRVPGPVPRLGAVPAAQLRRRRQPRPVPAGPAAAAAPGAGGRAVAGRLRRRGPAVHPGRPGRGGGRVRHPRPRGGAGGGGGAGPVRPLHRRVAGPAHRPVPPAPLAQGPRPGDRARRRPRSPSTWPSGRGPAGRAAGAGRPGGAAARWPRCSAGCRPAWPPGRWSTPARGGLAAAVPSWPGPPWLWPCSAGGGGAA